jgi:hypothetical protein
MKDSTATQLGEDIPEPIDDEHRETEVVGCTRRKKGLKGGDSTKRKLEPL